jgi:hypothetical protein
MRFLFCKVRLLFLDLFNIYYRPLQYCNTCICCLWCVTDCKEIRIAVNMSYVVDAVCIFIDFKSDHYIFQFFILANGFDSC